MLIKSTASYYLQNGGTGQGDTEKVSNLMQKPDVSEKSNDDTAY